MKRKLVLIIAIVLAGCCQASGQQVQEMMGEIIHAGFEQRQKLVTEQIPIHVRPVFRQVMKWEFHRWEMANQPEPQAASNLSLPTPPLPSLDDLRYLQIPPAPRAAPSTPAIHLPDININAIERRGPIRRLVCPPGG